MRSSAITSALITKLLADSALLALAPDGVFRDVAGASMATGGSAKRFVIVSFVMGINTLAFQQRSHQQALYLVEARMLSTAGGDANAAAARIDELLDPQPPAPRPTLTIPGYRLMAMYQEEPTEQTEFDEADASLHWNRVGGRYRVWAAPTST